MYSPQVVHRIEKGDMRRTVAKDVDAWAFLGALRESFEGSKSGIVFVDSLTVGHCECAGWVEEIKKK